MKSTSLALFLSIVLPTSAFCDPAPSDEKKNAEGGSTSAYDFIDARWRGLREIEAALIRFKTTYGRYPGEEEGLSVLCEAPKTWKEKKEWKPFLEPVSLIDGWGNPFIYRMHPPGRVLGIYSTGEDGLSSTHGEDGDDLNTWSKDKKNRFSPNVGENFLK